VLVVVEKMVEERLIWKEEGLQALPEEVKEVELKGQREMKEQGNWVFDWAGKNWEVMEEGWRNWSEKMKKVVVIKHHQELEELQQGKHLEKGWLKPLLHKSSLKNKMYY